VKKSRFNEAQIIGVMREQEAGSPTAEVCWRHGISEQTSYRWKAKYSGMSVSDAQKLKTLEDENRRLMMLLAESMLDVSALKDQSQVSSRIAGAFYPPYFTHPTSVTPPEMDSGMDAGDFTFDLDNPPNFQRDLIASREPTVQLNVDATRMTQAFIGAGFIQQILQGEPRWLALHCDFAGCSEWPRRSSPQEDEPWSIEAKLSSGPMWRRRGTPSPWLMASAAGRCVSSAT